MKRKKPWNGRGGAAPLEGNRKKRHSEGEREI